MAFEHITSTARKNRLIRMRTAFLADPTAYVKEDFNWRTKLYPNNTIYCSATAAGGGNGTAELPYKKSEWDSAQAPYQRTVFIGDFRGSSAFLNAQYDHMTLDLRQATLSRGNRINHTFVESLDSGIYGSNAYKIPRMSDTTANFTCTDAFINVVVNRQPLVGWSKTLCANAGAIRVMSVSSSTGQLYVRSPWALQVGELVAFLPGAFFPTSIGPISYQTSYYVSEAGAFGIDGNIQSGYQYIRLSATLGGPSLSFSSGEAVDFSPIGSQYAQLFSLHKENTGAQVPNKETLNEGEFAYEPWEEAIYVRLSEPLLSSHEIIVTSTQGAGPSISNKEDVHVLGGTIYGTHRAILFDEGSLNCSAWGVVVKGSNRGICMQTLPKGTMTRFCEASHSKYAMASEEFSTGEERTSHKYFYIHDIGTWVHNWGDRQPLMVNPQSGYAIFEDGLIEDCGVASFGSVTLPANRWAPIISTWGTAVNDGSSQAVMRNIYFSRCYGPNAFSNVTDQLIEGVTVEWCVFDMRGMSAAEAKGAASIWALAQNTGSGILQLVANDNLHLLADVGQAPIFDGTRRSSGVLTAVSATSCPVEVQIRRSIVYGGSGTDSTLYMLQNNSEPTVAARPVVDTDENTYYCPDIDYLMVATSTDNTKPVWQTSFSVDYYKLSSVAMPVTPGPCPSWTAGGYTNDANSTVATEDEMAAIGLLYSAWGEAIGEVPRPWFARQHT